MNIKMKIPSEGAVLLVNKSTMMSSFDVIRKIKKITSKLKMGHAGTLDELASGLLIIAIGKATKLISIFQDLSKTYSATVLLGIKTETDDVLGKVVENCKSDISFDSHDIESVLSDFKGEIEQMPPVYSALKVNGNRAYKLARQGEKVSLKKRKVTIYDLKLTGMTSKSIDILVKCSKGTYIRSIARDIGDRLGYGGCIEVLNRDSIGPFTVQNALDLDDLTIEKLQENMIPLNKALTFLQDIYLPDDQSRAVLQGIMPPDNLMTDNPGSICLKNTNEEILAVIRQDEEKKWKFVTVFN
ncbi:MAG: tRNA pseudouridine(55) synthase TruB [Spirochaetes bacterium]|nr:tRNA pseudouridine(55) synthase TruB [Spirochaetota bacterium]